MSDPELEPTGLAERVVRGAGLAGAGYVITQILALSFYVALARLASPQDFGELAAGTMLVSIGLLFTESGMLAALIHRPDRIDEAASTATVATVCAGLLFSLAALAAAPLIGALFESSRIGQVAAAASGLLLLRSLRVVPEALLQRRFSFLRQLVVQPAGVLVFGISAVIATANGLGVWGLVIGYYAAEVTGAMLSWTMVGWRPQLELASIAMWRELIRYGRHIVATIALERAQELIPVVLLGRFVGAPPLGQFGYATRMEATVRAVVVQAGAYVLFPALARISSNRERFREACMRSLRIMCAIGFPLGLVLLPLGVPAAVILFGDVWREAGYAAMALVALPSAGTVISFASETLKAAGRPEILTRIRGVIVLVATAFMLALLPLGVVGVAAGLSLGTVVGATYGLIRVSRLLEIPARDMVGEIAPSATAAIVMAGALLPLEFLVINASSRGTGSGIALLGAEALLGAVIYMVALWLIAPDTFGDLMSVVRRLWWRRRPDPEDAVSAKG